VSDLMRIESTFQNCTNMWGLFSVIPKEGRIEPSCIADAAAALFQANLSLSLQQGAEAFGKWHMHINLNLNFNLCSWRVHFELRCCDKFATCPWLHSTLGATCGVKQRDPPVALKQRHQLKRKKEGRSL
jgi:hypothetical protein